jgi:hypothetical protein
MAFYINNLPRGALLCGYLKFQRVIRKWRVKKKSYNPLVKNNENYKNLFRFFRCNTFTTDIITVDIYYVVATSLGRLLKLL